MAGSSSSRQRFDSCPPAAYNVTQGLYCSTEKEVMMYTKKISIMQAAAAISDMELDDA